MGGQNLISPKSVKNLIKENERLRTELKSLNHALDEHIRRSRIKARNRHRSNKTAIESRQVHNLYKQVENYKKSNLFLRKQVSKLSECQNESYTDLSLRNRKYQEKVKMLKKEIKTLNRKLNRPVSPSHDTDREIKLMQDLNKIKDEVTIARRRHQKDLEKIREIEKKSRSLHGENCELKDALKNLKKEMAFKSHTSPKKTHTKYLQAKKKIEALHENISTLNERNSKLDNTKKQLQKLTFRQNKEIYQLKVAHEAKDDEIIALRKIVEKKN